MLAFLMLTTSDSMVGELVSMDSAAVELKRPFTITYDNLQNVELTLDFLPLCDYTTYSENIRVSINRDLVAWVTMFDSGPLKELYESMQTDMRAIGEEEES